MVLFYVENRKIYTPNISLELTEKRSKRNWRLKSKTIQFEAMLWLVDTHLSRYQSQNFKLHKKYRAIQAVQVKPVLCECAHYKPVFTKHFLKITKAQNGNGTFLSNQQVHFLNHKAAKYASSSLPYPKLKTASMLISART